MSLEVVLLFAAIVAVLLGTLALLVLGEFVDAYANARRNK